MRQPKSPLTGALRTTAFVGLFAGLLVLIYFAGSQLGLPFNTSFSPGQPAPTGTPLIITTSENTATSLPTGLPIIATVIIQLETPTPGPSITPSPPPLVSVWPEIGSANLYSGPGTSYEIVGTAISGIDYQSIAGSPDGNWIQIEFPDTPASVAWLYAAYLQIGDGGLPVLAGLPTPTLFTMDGQPPQPLELRWQTSPFAEGSVQDGWLYVVLRQVGPPFSRQLGRISLDCLYTSTQCPAEIVPGWPDNGDYTLAWSPDGSVAALANLNAAQLLLFAPQTDSWGLLSDNFPAINDILLWSPDGAWIASSLQGADPDTALVTILSQDGAQERVLSPDLAGFQTPVAWLDARTLLFEVSHIPPKGSNELLIPPLFITVNVETGVWQQFQVQPSGVGKGSPVFSPDASRFIMQLPPESGGGLAAINLDDWQALPLGMDGTTVAWSPNSQWLALSQAVEGGYKIFVNRPDWQQVFSWPGSVSLLWLPDNRHLLVTVWATLDTPTTLFLVDTEQGSVRQLVNPSDFPPTELVFPSLQHNPLNPLQ